MSVSVYLHGSAATGHLGPGSDVDVVVIVDVAALLAAVPGASGRRVDLVMVDRAEVAESHLWRNAMRTARRLHGPPVALGEPEPSQWAAEARQAAHAAAERDAGPRDRQAAVAWLRAAERVEAGGPIPAGKHEMRESVR